MIARTPHLLASAALCGCLSVPDSAAPMCHVDGDCDHEAGEVCEEGVCWGDPPPGPFAAVISPPSGRYDLISRDVSQIAIPPAGWISDLALDAPVMLSGKLTSFCPISPAPCDPTPIGGTVTVSRPSRFPGGPGFTAVVTVAAGTQFSIAVPPTETGDALYTVTIVPETGDDAADRTASQIVPPRRLKNVPIADNVTTQAIALGSQDLITITGRLLDARGFPLPGYRVAAPGRWEPGEPASEVSTAAFSDADGRYTVTLSDALTGTVDLVARPARNGLAAPAIAPTVRVGNLDALQSSSLDLRVPGNLGNPATLALTVQGVDLSGAVAPVTGAQVVVTGTVTDASGVSATVSDEQIANAKGQVTLSLLDGPALASAYRMSVTPPAGSSLGAVFDQPVSIQATSQIRLTKRIAVTGRVVDVAGEPVRSATVTARPSLRFLWTLDAAPQAFVAAIPAGTTATVDDGEFKLWVDASVAQVFGRYDLTIEPPASLRVPAYVVSDIAIPSTPALDAVALHDIRLPEPSFVHGAITDPSGKPVEDAELKLYLVTTQSALCTEVAHAPASCPIPAQLQARNTSDSAGAVRLALPR